MKLWRKPFDHAEKATIQARIEIDKERCKGCGYCIEFCPRDVLGLSSEINAKGYSPAMIKDEARCLACGFCESICPEFAIKVITTSNIDNATS